MLEFGPRITTLTRLPTLGCGRVAGWWPCVPTRVIGSGGLVPPRHVSDRRTARTGQPVGKKGRSGEARVASEGCHGSIDVSFRLTQPLCRFCQILRTPS